ncbi:hypothetical protein PR048_024848 [Dryococelus australis]|uniref:Uncharacterized protein n=1 Tax=Dryococelus australis TaxID=614101 RepID=A0ABQ9GPP8_9NEOP|nr:hypothetical protein PR048_024848 [Dryococelus australis]
MSAYTRQKAKSKYRNRIRLKRASQKQTSDTHKTPYIGVKMCRERKINIKASERVDVDRCTRMGATVFCVDLRPDPGSSFEPRWCNRALECDPKRNNAIVSTRCLRWPFVWLHLRYTRPPSRTITRWFGLYLHIHYPPVFCVARGTVLSASRASGEFSCAARLEECSAVLGSTWRVLSSPRLDLEGPLLREHDVEIVPGSDIEMCRCSVVLGRPSFAGVGSRFHSILRAGYLQEVSVFAAAAKRSRSDTRL